MAKYVYATDPRVPIPIGVQGENDAVTVVWDISKWVEYYGNGSPLLVHQRPGDAEPYPCGTELKGGQVEWLVQQADTAIDGYGRCQLSYQVGDNIVARTPIYYTIAADEITSTPVGDYDPAQSWIDDLLDAVNKAGDITSDVEAAQTAATQAGQSATAAAGSASDAAESATAAAESAAEAAQHAGEVTAGVAAAAESASQAAESATAAKASETASGQSAAAAAESEGNASESATAAEAAQAAAEEAAQSAKDYSGKPPIVQSGTWWTWNAETDAYQDTGVQATGDKGDKGDAAGFGTPVVTVDNNTGTPSATVEASGPDTDKVFTFNFYNLKGDTGATGTAAGWGTVTATVDDTVGDPGVTVSATGPDTAKNIVFAFTGLKGVQGDQGNYVARVERTAGTGAPGTTDTYTMYDDGGETIGTFTVYNGINGTGAGDLMADGSVAMTGNLNAGNNKITNVAAPTEDGDAANKAYVDSAVDNVEIVKTASGSAISVSDSADYRLLGLKLYGKSVQDGVPTPEAPVEIESAGDSGNITATICGTNLLDFSGAVGGTSAGITATLTGDGGYVMTGTATETAINIWFLGNYSGEINVFTLYPGTYTCKNILLFYGQSSFTTVVNMLPNVPYTFTISQKVTITGVRCVSAVAGTTYNETLYPILVRGNSLPEWEPYKSQTFTLSAPNGLRAIPVDSGGEYTDEDGQEWIGDYADLTAKKLVTKIARVDAASFLKRNVMSGTGGSRFSFAPPESTINLSKALCNYLAYRAVSSYGTAGNYVTIDENKVNIRLTDDITLEEFQQKYPDLYVLYQLEAPVKSDIVGVPDFYGYKPNTTITTDSSPAAGIEVKYLTDSGVAEVLDYYASKADLDGKQDKLSGTTGQFVGFDAEGEAEAQDITAADVGAVAVNGTIAMAGDFNVGGHRVTNVGAPTAAGDAVRQSDLQAVSDEIDGIIAGTTPVTVPVATAAKAGVVMPGAHLSVETDGTLNAEWPDLSPYATEDWVNNKNYLTTVPDGYATQDWVNERGFLTAVPAEYITEDELAAKGYLTAVPAEYVTDTELMAKGYATSADVAATYAPKALKFTGTFTASGWTSATGGYNQTVSVAGLTADDEPVIDLNSTATDADTFNGQLEAFGLVSNFTTGAGTLTAVVLGDSAPEVDIPIHGVVVY